MIFDFYIKYKNRFEGAALQYGNNSFDVQLENVSIERCNVSFGSLAFQFVESETALLQLACRNNTVAHNHARVAGGGVYFESILSPQSVASCVGRPLDGDAASAEGSPMRVFNNSALCWGDNFASGPTAASIDFPVRTA